MGNLLERYERGEYEQVWNELADSGPAIRKQPLYDEVCAVAKSTMLRVRHNIEQLIPRLQSLGFTFGYHWVPQPQYAQRDEEAAGAWRHWIQEAQREYRTFQPPAQDAAERITALEHATGILPISLRAWYEVVGAVDLVGEPPAHWTRETLGYPPPDKAAEQALRARFAAAAGSHGLTGIEYHHLMRKNDTLWHAANDWDIYLDPLCVLPVEVALDEHVAYINDTFGIPVSPDWAYKWFQGGDEPYLMVVPNPDADALVMNEWHDARFVDYLRIAFRWGGFPGLARAAQPPKEDIAFLTESLLPF